MRDITRLSVIIILQYIQTSSHCAVHLKLIMLYVSYISKKKNLSNSFVCHTECEWARALTVAATPSSDFTSLPLWPRLRPLPVWLPCSCYLVISLFLQHPTSGPLNLLFPTPGGIFPYSSFTACQITTTLRNIKCFFKGMDQTSLPVHLSREIYLLLLQEKKKKLTRNLSYLP